MGVPNNAVEIGAGFLREAGIRRHARMVARENIVDAVELINAVGGKVVWQEDE